MASSSSPSTKMAAAIPSASGGTSCRIDRVLGLVLQIVIHYNHLSGDAMASPLTLRLDEKTRQRIARIARRKRLSTSEVIRQAIEAWAQRQEAAGSPYEAVGGLIGGVRGGNPTRSEQTGRRFSKLLKSPRGDRVE